MPNDVMNVITLYGEAEEIEELKKEYGMEDPHAALLDFNKVIPMPDALNIEAGSETDHGIWLYLMAASPYDSWPEAEAWGYEKLSPEAYVQLKARFPDRSENRYQRERAAAESVQVSDSMVSAGAGHTEAVAMLSSAFAQASMGG